MKVVDGVYKPACKGQGNSEWGTLEIGMSPNERRKSSSLRTSYNYRYWSNKTISFEYRIDLLEEYPPYSPWYHWLLFFPLSMLDGAPLNQMRREGQMLLQLSWCFLFFWKGLFDHRISSNVMVHHQYLTGGDLSQNVRRFIVWFHNSHSFVKSPTGVPNWIHLGSTRSGNQTWLDGISTDWMEVSS